jgi:hypothetical protein
MGLMTNSTKVKFVVSFVIGLYAAAFVVKNANYRTDVWLFFFVQQNGVSTLTVMMISAGLALAIGWIAMWWLKRDGSDD